MGLLEYKGKKVVAFFDAGHSTQEVEGTLSEKTKIKDDYLTFEDATISVHYRETNYSNALVSRSRRASFDKSKLTAILEQK